MDIIQLLKESPGIQVSVRLADLIEANRRLIEETREETTGRRLPEAEAVSPESLITTSEAEDLLRISHTTLWRRVNEGMITPVRFGKAVRFRLGDIRKLING